MKKFLSVLMVAGIFFATTGCKKDDDAATVPLRDYAEQYATEKAELDIFLKTHKCVVEYNANGDVISTEFEAVEEGSPDAVWDSPMLEDREVTAGDVTYKVYYLRLKTGGGGDPDNLKLNPCSVDGVLAAYKGEYLYRPTYTDEDAGIIEGVQTLAGFETVNFPQTVLNLESTIRGWGEVFPQFRPGDIIQVEGQPTEYRDYGAGVMFVPSGLAYYANYTSGIPSYSTLIFSFRLYAVQQLDQDGDGIPSYYEDIDGDGYLYYFTDLVSDDTDGDGIPDYRDVDDDGDDILTKTELLQNYPNGTDYFNYFTVPDANGDATNPDRLRRYLDPAWPPQN